MFSLVPPRIRLLLWLPAAVLAMGVAWLAIPLFRHIYPGCLIAVITGRPCPGCGGTRALWSLLNGRPLEALRYNAAVPFALLALLYTYIEAWLRAYNRSAKVTLQGWFWGVLAGGWLVYAAVRAAAA